MHHNTHKDFYLGFEFIFFPSALFLIYFLAKYFNVGTVAVFGSVVVFNDAFFIWRVKDVNEITIESLSIFEIYSPSICMFIFFSNPINLPHFLFIFDRFSYFS